MPVFWESKLEYQCVGLVELRLPRMFNSLIYLIGRIGVKGVHVKISSYLILP